MASSYHHLLLSLLLLGFCSVSFSSGQTSPPNFLAIPIYKHGVGGNQYVAQISHGTSRRTASLRVDLGGELIGLDCSRSTSHRSVSCPSLECSKAGRSGSRNQQLSELGELAEDVVEAGFEKLTGSVSIVDRFLFYCLPRSGLRRLVSSGADGVLGLGRSSRISFPSQFSMTHLLDRKFSLCLSEKGGKLLLGDALYGTELSKTLTYTPLISSNEAEGSSHEHFVILASIKIVGVAKSIEVNGRARLSTTSPYTTLQSSVYEAFSKDYIDVAVFLMNMTRAEPVWPFRTCFVLSQGGAVVPEVDLVLQSKMVKWRITGRNLIVPVMEGVSCLGVLDGGVDAVDRVVIGSFQLEERLLEFDMARSILGFSSSLVGKGSSCFDELKFESARPSRMAST